MQAHSRALEQKEAENNKLVGIRMMIYYRKQKGEWINEQEASRSRMAGEYREIARHQAIALFGVERMPNGI